MASGWKTRRPQGASTAAIYRTTAHRKARAALMAQLVADGVGRCCLGGEAIYPSMGRNLHADHCPTCRGHGCGQCNGSGYRGLACADHNRRDGARRGRAKQSAPPPSVFADW